MAILKACSNVQLTIANVAMLTAAVTTKRSGTYSRNAKLVRERATANSSWTNPTSEQQGRNSRASVITA